jgi:hypothetical protein
MILLFPNIKISNKKQVIKFLFFEVAIKDIIALLQHAGLPAGMTS